MKSSNHKLHYYKVKLFKRIINPLKGGGVNWLHFAIQVQPTFLMSDIRALWRSALSARVPECQKLKMQAGPEWH